MNILICDDEIKYIEDIEKNVNNFFVEKSQQVNFFTFTDADKLLTSDNNYYDIAFLDVEIGNIKGTDVARVLKTRNPHIVLFFITAYSKYLDDAMDLEAFRFLTKPLDICRLLDGLNKAISLIDKTAIEFMLKDGAGICKVTASDIVFIEICGHCTNVFTADNKYYSENSIKCWKEKLIPSYFYQVHKSFIVNTNCITKYKRDKIELNNSYVIPVSYRKQAAFRKFILSSIEGR